MGVVSEFPDLIFFGSNGEVCAVELKAKNGRLSESQAAVKRHLEQAGHSYLVSSDYREVIEKPKDWGVVRSGIHVQ